MNSSANIPKIDVVIPTYKPGKELFTLLERLHGQTIPINRILLMNTEEKYLEQLLYGTEFQDGFGKLVNVYHLSKREFDHGKTRHIAVQKSEADIFVMMTQDALPADNKLIEELVGALQKEQTAVAYARQLPKEDCHIIERYTRRFNYPDKSGVKTRADLDTLGIKTYFCSNVCAAYKRSVYDELGGFVRHTIFNEDMIYAAEAVKAGYGIAYVAEAKVLHSHNYTNRQQFKRNFDLGVSQAEHPEIFAHVSSEKEGKKMVSETFAWLWKSKKKHLCPYFFMQCASKYAGYFLGKHFRILPAFIIEKCTSNKQYWHQRV